MSDFLKRILPLMAKALALGCFLILLTVPARAQDQGAKDQAAKDKVPPPKETPQPRMRTMSPRPATKASKGEEESPRQMPTETLERKKVTGTAGGQEIRAKEGQEDK